MLDWEKCQALFMKGKGLENVLLELGISDSKLHKKIGSHSTAKGFFL